MNHVIADRIKVLNRSKKHKSEAQVSIRIKDQTVTRHAKVLDFVGDASNPSSITIQFHEPGLGNLLASWSSKS